MKLPRRAPGPAPGPLCCHRSLVRKRTTFREGNRVLPRSPGGPSSIDAANEDGVLGRGSEFSLVPWLMPSQSCPRELALVPAHVPLEPEVRSLKPAESARVEPGVGRRVRAARRCEMIVAHDLLPFGRCPIPRSRPSICWKVPLRIRPAAFAEVVLQYAPRQRSSSSRRAGSCGQRRRHTSWRAGGASPRN
jgi:hypothetical protein